MFHASLANVNVAVKPLQQGWPPMMAGPWTRQLLSRYWIALQIYTTLETPDKLRRYVRRKTSSYKDAMTSLGRAVVAL